MESNSSFEEIYAFGRPFVPADVLVVDLRLFYRQFSFFCLVVPVHLDPSGKLSKSKIFMEEIFHTVIITNHKSQKILYKPFLYGNSQYVFAYYLCWQMLVCRAHNPKIISMANFRDSVGDISN